MATIGPNDVKPKSKPATKAAGGSVFGMRWQCPLQAQLGRKLQAAFRDSVEEPIPENLVRLLDGLRRKEKEKDDAPSAGGSVRDLPLDEHKRKEGNT
jgi:hypothetical protein